MLRIGPLAVDPAVVLAPMAGVTNAAFRALCREYGAGLYVSEMTSARALVEGNARTRDMVAADPGGDVHSVQLYGVDPRVVGRAVRQLVDDHGVDHVDLNMGCPSPKVTRRGGGAALLVHTVLFRDLVREAVRAAGEIPVTVKMRIGVDDETVTYLDCGRIAAAEGVAAVALHARTAEQLYSGRADWSAIARLRDAVADDVPVLGNGDIWRGVDATRMVAETGCDGVVIGRGCLGRPWLFRDLVDVFAGRTAEGPPLLGEVMRVMRRHAQLIVEHKGDEVYGMRDFRKHVGWYFTGYPVGPERRRLLGLVSSLAELDELLAPLDPATVLPPEADALPRGHSHGPRPVSLPDRWKETADDPTPPDDEADVAVSGG